VRIEQFRSPAIQSIQATTNNGIKMKTIFAIITLMSALLAFPILAAENDKAVPTIEERLAQSDLSVTLKQYEKVRQLEADAKLELALLAVRPDEATKKEREAITKRMQILNEEAAQLRFLAYDYDRKTRENRSEIAAVKK
jgi:hypothetical protein